MLPNIIHVMSNFVASLQGGDGTGSSAKVWLVLNSLYANINQSKNISNFTHHSTLLDQTLSTLRSLFQNYPFKIFKLKFKDNIVARAFNWRENEI